MLVLGIVLTCIVLLASGVWFSRHRMISRERKADSLLGPESPGFEGDPPRISVLVAAKDEQENIEPCIRSMLRQDYPNFEMIVCNDRSEDATRSIVEAIAGEDPRLRLINIEHLPEGWAGKCHAMANGTAAADGEWLCLTDADCRQVCPRTLSVAMRYAADHGIDLLSALPVLEMKSFWEKVVQPVCSGVMIIWFNPAKVNDPSTSKAYANGAFILIRRSAYDRIGAHAAVRDKLMEDLHFARRIKQAELRLRVIRSSGLYTVRMYTSLKEILRGWSRIFFGTFGTLPRLIVSLLVVLIMGLLPYVAVVLGLVMGIGGAEHAGWWLACGVVGLAAAGTQISAIYRYYKLTGACKELAWTYPLGCVMAIAALVIAMTKHRRGARLVWRNTSYSTGRRP